MSAMPSFSVSDKGSTAKLRAVELFAGIGGFRIASDNIGIQTVWANDINKKAVAVYRSRYGDNSVVLGDINDLIDVVPEHDILTGGFPCQPFSRAGKKMGIDDYRGTLFESIVKILEARHPQYFFLENVNSLLFLDNGRHFRTILFALSELGYKIEWRVFNAVAFGLPQQRLRVLITGCRNVDANETFLVTQAELATLSENCCAKISDSRNWREIVSSRGKFPQWGMALNSKFTAFDFAPPQGIKSERKLKDILQREVATEFDFTENTLKRIEQSEFIDKFYNGVHILYNQGHGARMGYTIFGTDGVAPTLTASASRHYERYEIDGRYRRLTNIEYARLQGFPDDYCNAVSVYDQYKLYGNAVPPLIVEYVMRRVLENRRIRVELPELPLFKQDFNRKNLRNERDGKDMIPLEHLSHLESAAASQTDVILQAEGWVSRTLNENWHSPSNAVWQRILTRPLEGKIGMSFALQWRYNFATIFRR